MDKPEWCPKDIWSDALQVAIPLPIGLLGQKTLAREVAKAILSAQSQAYIDAARIAYGMPDYVQSPMQTDDRGRMLPGSPYDRGRYDASNAILQRKEDIGR